MSLSLVLGIPITAILLPRLATSRTIFIAARIVPSPPITNIRLIPMRSRQSTTTAGSCSPRDDPRIVPPCSLMSLTTSGVSSITPRRVAGTNPWNPLQNPYPRSTPYRPAAPASLLGSHHSAPDTARRKSRSLRVFSLDRRKSSAAARLVQIPEVRQAGCSALPPLKACRRTALGPIPPHHARIARAGSTTRPAENRRQRHQEY